MLAALLLYYLHLPGRLKNCYDDDITDIQRKRFEKDVSESEELWLIAIRFIARHSLDIELLNEMLKGRCSLSCYWSGC